MTSAGGDVRPRVQQTMKCQGPALPTMCTSCRQAGAVQSSVGIIWQLGFCTGEVSHARMASRGHVEGSRLETEVRSCWELCVAGAISPDSCPTAPRASGPVKRVPWASYHERLDLCVGHVQRRVCVCNSLYIRTTARRHTATAHTTETVWIRKLQGVGSSYPTPALAGHNTACGGVFSGVVSKIFAVKKKGAGVG